MQTLAVPACGDGITSATVSQWHIQQGATFNAGDLLVTLELAHALVEVSAKEPGTLLEIAAQTGQTLRIGGELARIQTGKQLESAGAVVTAPKNSTAPVSASSGSVPILMPQAGNSMEEGTILKWRVKVGDQIAVGQIIAEIETDKATIEMEATDAGTIAQIVADVGAVVPIKQPIAFLGTPGSSVASTAPSTTPAAAPQSAPVQPVTSSAAVTPILMPQAGNSMEEGTILKWRVREGDRITIGQIICEVETDKATVEVEATDAGRIAQIVAPEGTVVPVKQPMAYLSEGTINLASLGTTAPAKAESKTPAIAAPLANTTTPTAASKNEFGRVKASPAARKLATEKGIDLASIPTGSGPGGRILSTDLASGSKLAPSTPKTTPAPAGILGGKYGDIVTRPLSKMRKAIANNLQMSKQTVPHWYIRLTINAEPLFAFYKAQKPVTGCTVNDVILLAVGKVVGEFPLFRSHIEGNEILETQSAHIGIAVGVPDGLVVPVVLGVDKLSLSQLAKESKRIVENARVGKLENIGRAVFTISNLGMFGIEEFAAIINPPESGILAISALRESVVVKDGAIRAARVMTVTLSTDHRVVDGTVAATFMARLRELLENPEKIIA